MARLYRRDRVLLEDLEQKYGIDALSSAIIAIANQQNGVEERAGSTSPTEAVLDFIKYIEGVRIRLREMHWATEVHAQHTLTDSIISTLEDTEDNIAEDLMGVCGFRIKVGAVVPLMTNQVELESLLDELHEKVSQLTAALENGGDTYGGIVNVLEDLMHQIGKWRYLATFK